MSAEEILAALRSEDGCDCSATELVDALLEIASARDVANVDVARLRVIIDEMRHDVRQERDACLGDIEHEISAHGSGSREGIALHAAAARIMRRARS